MASGEWTTTPDEDLAILGLGIDHSVGEFVERHLKHQIEFALSQAALSTGTKLIDAYTKADPATKASIEQILAPKKVEGLING